MKEKNIFIVSVIGVFLLFLGSISLFYFFGGIGIDEEDFVGIRWTRDEGSDIEFIIFSEDGSYIYYCSCGNPVDDSDLYDTFTYNRFSGKIILYSDYTSSDTIKVLYADGEKLELEFDEGDIRVFEKYESFIR